LAFTQPTVQRLPIICLTIAPQPYLESLKTQKKSGLSDHRAGTRGRRSTPSERHHRIGWLSHLSGGSWHMGQLGVWQGSGLNTGPSTPTSHGLVPSLALERLPESKLRGLGRSVEIGARPPPL
jgi:hypothetical protein